MSKLKFICPNCKKEFTKIIHKGEAFQILSLIDFKEDNFQLLKLTGKKYLELRCPECNTKILPPLEDEILRKMRKKYPEKPSKYRVHEGGVDIIFET